MIPPFKLRSEPNGISLVDEVSAPVLSYSNRSAIAPFRSIPCFGSSLLTFLLVTNGALAIVQPSRESSQITLDQSSQRDAVSTDAADLLLTPPTATDALPSIDTPQVPVVDEDLQSTLEETVHPSIVMPELDAESLEGAIAVDADKLEWARQKLLGRQLEERLASEQAAAIAAEATEATEEMDKAAEEDETKTADANESSTLGAIADAVPRWVATSMPLSVTFPDFSIQDFLNLPLRLPGNGNIRAMFPLPIPASITSLFGWRQHPLLGEWRLHQGIDLAAPEGTPVLAAFSGTVKAAEVMGGYGITVILEHSDGTQETLYAHLSQILVEPGDWVEQGTALGRVGSTGSSTGPHLHFELRQLTDQGWVALDVNGLMQQALAEFGELPVAILDMDPNAPRSLKSPKKLDEFGKLAGRVVQSQNVSHPRSAGLFREV